VADEVSFIPPLHHILLVVLTVVGRFCSLSPQMQKKLQKLDFSYFCAIMAPNAPRKEYRTICDWGNWVRSVIMRVYVRTLANYSHFSGIPI
jgi:hypothetical protein